MDDSQAEMIVRRLLGIERRLDEMDQRLKLFEGSASVMPPVPTEPTSTLGVENPLDRDPEPTLAPPPIQPPQPPAPSSPPPPQPTWEKLPLIAGLAWKASDAQPRPSGQIHPSPASFATPPKKSSVSGDDLEYKIGRIGLLWAGAVVVLIGILYLVALAAAHTTATPQLRFAGEQVLCAAFIIVGFIKRNEREEFGQLLTGIGSCGLYISFAGGLCLQEPLLRRGCRRSVCDVELRQPRLCGLAFIA